MSTSSPRAAKKPRSEAHNNGSSSTSHPAIDMRSLIVELCKQFYHLGWVTGTGGSISIRQGNDLYMTPSGVQKERLIPSDLFVLSMEGDVLEAPTSATTGRPLRLSACAPLFLHAYKLRNAGAVLHSHGMYCVLACELAAKRGRREFRIQHQEMVKGLEGYNYHSELVVPIIENTAAEEDLADSLAEAITMYPKSNAVLVRNHGVYVWGSTWEKAKTQSECLHYLLKLACQLENMGIDAGSVPRTGCRDCGIPPTHSTHTGVNIPTSRVPSPKYVLLDIEGTTTPISFVKDTLFPYSCAHVAEFLTVNWDDEVVRRLAMDVCIQSQSSECQSLGAPLIPTPVWKDDITAAGLSHPEIYNKFIEKVVENVIWNVQKDRKIKPVKDLQGAIWKGGYESGELKAAVYADVEPALRRWISQGRKIAIYSSGSRQAQRLFFENSTSGDLSVHVSAYFDTSCGMKQESKSYTEIALTLGVSRASDILFITDVFEEANAAKEAGLQTTISERPGNKILPPGTADKFTIVRDFRNVLP